MPGNQTHSSCSHEKYQRPFYLIVTPTGRSRFQGRYTLTELFLRLRKAGYLRAVGIDTHNPADALEQLLDHLSGGKSFLKFHYIVDRRDFLERLKALKLLNPPRLKKRAASDTVI